MIKNDLHVLNPHSPGEKKSASDPDFVLFLKAEKQLRNGFRYIKELLMQYHNFYLNTCRELLTENGVDVYAVKTDAFTIQQSQLEAAEELLTWQSNIGSWSRNMTEDIRFTTDKPLITQ